MANEEAREAELDGYIHAAQELNRIGNELRDQGYAGRDGDVSLAPLVFLRLIETARAEGIRQAREAVAGEERRLVDLWLGAEAEGASLSLRAIDALGEDDR